MPHPKKEKPEERPTNSLKQIQKKDKTTVLKKEKDKPLNSRKKTKERPQNNKKKAATTTKTEKKTAEIQIC